MTAKKLGAPKSTAGALEALKASIDSAVTAPEAEKQESSTRAARRAPASASSRCSTKSRSSRWTRWSRHRSRNFGLEKNRPYGDGVVSGYGTIDNRQVAVYSQDFTVFGGSLGEVHGQKITKIQDFALRTGVPRSEFPTPVGPEFRRASRPSPSSPRFPAQRCGLGRNPENLDDPRPVGGRRGLLPRAHGFHRHGGRHLADVHHRSRRHQGRSPART